MVFNATSNNIYSCVEVRVAVNTITLTPTQLYILLEVALNTITQLCRG